MFSRFPIILTATITALVVVITAAPAPQVPNIECIVNGIDCTPVPPVLVRFFCVY